ncbi:MAG: hypothetical protein M1121_01305 [Actinobacteria bacterium]|nr:hypothetical protein [Actinomycetota bacterium]
MSFLSLEAGFTQAVYGVYPTFFGGVAFGPSGTVLVDECQFSGSPLVVFSQSQTYTQDSTNLHQSTVLPSNAGCGLTDGPGGYLYSNTSSGVTRLDAATGVQVGPPMGPPGNALGITVDPANGSLVYVGADCRFTGTCTIYSLDPTTGVSSVFATLPGYDFIDGVTFDPTGNYLLMSTRAPFFALTVLNSTGQVVQNVNTTSEPDGIAFHRSPAFVVTDNTDGTMTSFAFPNGDLTAAPSVSSFASGGFRGDLALVASDGCMYLSQNGVRYNDGTTSYQDSIVEICPGFVPSPGVSQVRTVVFVHGINGRFNQFECRNLKGGFKAILLKICDNPYAFNVLPFAYYQDMGYASSTGPPCSANGGMPPPDQYTGLLYVDPNSISADICDSKGALAFSSAALDKELSNLPGPASVVANSMGAAIARGWLTIAWDDAHTDAREPYVDNSLTNVDSVVFLQGAQAGSWAAGAGEALNSYNSFVAPLLDQLMVATSSAAGLDVNRPGVIDVAPVSRWYRSVNTVLPSPGVPRRPAYFNFYSNLNLNFVLQILWASVSLGSVDVGDTVMLPGSNNPTSTPLLGGAKFLPGNQQTATRHQFAMNANLTVNPADAISGVNAISTILYDPVTHLNFPNKTGIVDVQSCIPSAGRISAADQVLAILDNPKGACT